MPQVTVVVPTLGRDAVLAGCVEALQKQSWRDFAVVVVDNSGRGEVRRSPWWRFDVQLLESPVNLGFGGAINEAAKSSASRYVATINDDAVAAERWLEALVRAMESDPKAGMCASHVRLAGTGLLDSAGMLLCADGSSKQRAHGEPVSGYLRTEEVLFPSGSAALYRREMLSEIGWFDERFFLYCEDTDVGLRGRWAGWKCLYVPDAVVDHRYSHSAGRASPLKAYYVERNRLFVVAKNFPAPMIAAAPLVSLARYWWHAAAVARGRGAAGEFRKQGANPLLLVWYVVRAHLALAANWRRLWSARREILRTARLSSAEFRALARRHTIPAREVAAL